MTVKPKTPEARDMRLWTLLNDSPSIKGMAKEAWEKDQYAYRRLRLSEPTELQTEIALHLMTEEGLTEKSAIRKAGMLSRRLERIIRNQDLVKANQVGLHL